MRALRPITPRPTTSRPALTGATLVLAALLCACGGQPAAESVPAATDRCGEVEYPTLQFGSHLIGDASPPIDYSSQPPTSGWHSSGLPPIGLTEEELSEPQQVTALELGAVVITHRGLSADEQAQLEDSVGPAIEDRVVITPYDGIADGEVVLASWGAMQRCDGVDAAAIRAYVTTFANPVEHG